MHDMKGKIDIHDYDKKLRTAISNLEKSEVSQANKDVIKKYADFLFMDNIGKARILKYVSTLKIIARKINKDFAQASAEDLKTFLIGIHNNASYSIWTRFDYNVTIKKFYKWLEGDIKANEYPKKVSWIKTTVKKKDKPKVKKSELLGEEEIQKLLKAIDNPRDKALIALVWDTGARIGEIGGMTIKHVSFEDNATYADLVGKTGSRTCLAIESTPYLVRWLESHPARENQNSPLWLDRSGKSMTYAALAKVFRRAFEKAGIKKGFNPHLFRHSRATWCAENGWSSYEMCKHFGWEMDSGMPAVYISMVDKDVHNKMKEAYGINTDRQKKVEERKMKMCPRCDVVNPNHGKFCYKCGMSLDTKTALDVENKRHLADDLMLKLLKHPELKEILVKKLKEQQLDKEVKKIIGGAE